MGLIVKNFELPDGTLLDEVYMKVQKINSVSADFEFFENINDPTRPDVEQELKWIKRLENIASIYVWPDILARENRAQVIHWFTINFEYDLSAYENIYEQAYKRLKFIYPNSEGC